MFTVSFTTRINKKARQGTYLPQLKYGELEPIHIHAITRAERVTTEFGATIVIDLDSQWSLFLPKRTVKCFDGPEGEQDFKELQKAVKKASIGFRKTPDGISEFVELEKKKN